MTTMKKFPQYVISLLLVGTIACSPHQTEIKLQTGDLLFRGENYRTAFRRNR